jgi:outer membrane autotransporter protein
VPELRIENGIGATVSYSGVASQHTSAAATGVLVQAGGSLPRLTNLGTISAVGQGPTVNATAISDQSGTLATVVNQGAISATVTPGVSTATAGGKTIALDLRANTAGVSLTQSANPSPIALAGATDSTGKFVATVTTPATPSIVGDVLLGSGPNTVSLQAGTVNGALSLGSGAASLSIGGGAAYTGALSHANGAPFSIDVSNGTLTNTNASTLELTSLNVGPTSSLSFAVDSANARSTSYVVSGPATLANGAKVAVNLVSGITAAQSYTLIRSPNLQVGSISSLTPQTPYVIIAGLRLDQAAGTLNLDLRRRTATEAALDPAQTAAYDAVLKAAPSDAGVQGALFGPQDRAGFLALYNQMLPDYAGGTFRMATAAQRAIGRALGEGGAGGAWVQEISVGARQSSSANGVPFKALGFGLAGGLERTIGLGSLGLKVAFVTGDSHNHLLPGDNRSTLTDLDAGLYWRVSRGGFTFDVGGGGGYVRSTYRRQLLVTDAAGTNTLTRTAEGKAGGWSLNGRAGVAYQLNSGAFFVRPQAHLDYYRLNQGGYTETGGGSAFDLIVDSRKASEASGTVSLALGAQFGQDFTWRPQVEVGYRSILSGNAGTTRARFAGGDAFSIKALGLDGGGAMARLAVKAGNQLYDFSLSVGAEKRDDYVEGDFQIRARFVF